MLPNAGAVLLLILVLYAGIIRAALSLEQPWRERLFAAANILGVVAIFYWYPHNQLPYLKAFAVYFTFVSLQFFIMRFCFARGERMTLVPLLTPIAFLVLSKYVGLASLVPAGWQPVPIVVFLGVSYMTFRLSLLAMEIRNGVAAFPTFSGYIGYAFFMPIMLVGPISRYSVFERSLNATARGGMPPRRCIERIIVGLAKYFFLANLFNQLAYAGLMRNGLPHEACDLLVAVVAYYLFLYANFSGYCDMAIGFSGLMGIRVEENFNNPLLARNIKDFWNRWHITLSTFMRDMLFNPLSKALVTWMGVKYIDHAIVVTIFVVFLTIGVWHGVGWNFFWFGFAHAVGVATNHYYTLWLKRYLGKERFRAYNANRLIRFVAIGLTFSYVAATCMLFANTIYEIKTLFASLV